MAPRLVAKCATGTQWILTSESARGRDSRAWKAARASTQKHQMRHECCLVAGTAGRTDGNAVEESNGLGDGAHHLCAQLDVLFQGPWANAKIGWMWSAVSEFLVIANMNAGHMT